MKRFFLPLILTLATGPSASGQQAFNAVLLSALPKAGFCDREPSCVAAASFRLLETAGSAYKALDTVWLYIICPQNFSPGFWAADRTYELHVLHDTTTVRNIPRLSVPMKQPLGVVANARRITLR